MIYVLAWAALTALALFFVHRSGSPGLRRTGWAMVGNMFFVWLAVWSTGSNAPWEWFIVGDFITAMAILPKSASRPQAYIGAIYALQIIVHLAFGFGGASVFGERQYLDLLAFGGGCQLLILATGAIHGRGRKVADLGSSIGGAHRAVAPHPARMEPGP
jgi:hypothetical protein